MDSIPLMRLLADVAALKVDPVEQRQTLVDGLQRIFKTKIGWILVADNYRPGRSIVFLHQIVTSDATPGWLRYMADFSVNEPFEADAYAVHSLKCDDEIFILKRHEVLPDAAAEAKYPAFMRVVKFLEVGDGAIGAYRTGPNLDRIVGFSLHRDVSAPYFSEQEFELVLLAVKEIRDLERRGHITFRDAVSGDLPPRLGQILDRILSGHSAKRIAFDLDLSVHTVREHFQRIYQFYGVNSREALTAKFVK
jgi:DNA-binding CsgD family transcriptional regulator